MLKCKKKKERMKKIEELITNHPSKGIRFEKKNKVKNDLE